MNFQREPYSEALTGEMRPLWQRHFEETAAFQHIPLNPKLSIYHACAKVGSLRIYTARMSGSLCGYQIFFVSPHPHSQQSIQAVQDILYLDQDLRMGLAGYRFLKWCVNELKAEKVQVIHQRISAKKDFGRMFERMGFHLEDLVYSLEVI